MKSISLAIIPARGGSKRVKNKNIRDINGKPLIAWTIISALRSECYDIVLVSTDSEEIRDIAIEYGAISPFLRPAHLSTDTASSEDVVSHAISWVTNHYHCSIDSVTLLQPTSPLRTSNDIQCAMTFFREKNADSVISVCRLEYPIQFCNILPKDFSLDGFISEDNDKRTQDLDLYYRVNGAIYIFKPGLVRCFDSFYKKGSFAYVMSRMNSIDIDDEDDFTLASIILEKKNEKT